MLAIASLLLALSLHTILATGLALTLTPPSNPIPTTTLALLPTAPMTLYSSPTTAAAAEPAITASPELDGGEADAGAPDERFVQTTYWSCVKQPGVATAHCGWHEPIIDASMPNVAARGRGGFGGVVMVAGVVWAFLLVVV
ncbi:hypothetical protein CONLIGDRAFT_637526 [Coniochaeta ligniaria NRRL 30616]|uniref:Uncharacterized protein n=1 Tax=Coniochaeta ligniaria NRRL 30616 TaxID=1408157 RepID=A0A1J7J7S3_9PEZI|nr:hypothetical protein CONLIGDRAFT_637526 [Coniochaeta ligniaria NRRL 30616]